MFRSKSRVERRIVHHFWNDGLIDILSGIAVLLIGIAWQCDLVALGAVAPAMLIPFWAPLRKRITEPRLGYVEFSDDQEARQHSFLTWTIGIGCLTFAVAVGAYFLRISPLGGLPAERWIAAMPACLIGGLAAAVSLLILVPRFLGYGLVFVLAGIAVVLLDMRPGAAMVAGGIVVTCIGLMRLARFLHSHSPQPMESNGA
jgi:hypothetical protein